MNQTKRNLKIKYLSLSFVTTPKLTLLYSFFAEKVFISCVWLIRVSLVRTMDSVPRPSFFDTNISAADPFTFKVLNQIGNRQNFQLFEKKCFGRENVKKVVEDLGTGSFVTVTNIARHSCDCGEILPGKFYFNNLQGLAPLVKTK